MTIENPLAFSFIMQDDIYLLPQDKTAFADKPAVAAIPEPVEIIIPVVETQSISFNYLGGHKKNFLIIVHYPGLEFMDEKHLTALENTLKRLEYSLDDTAIFNIAKHAAVTFEQLEKFFNPKKLLIMGATSLPVGIDQLSLNSVKKASNRDALFTFSFDEMMTSNENKKVFWEQIKQL